MDKFRRPYQSRLPRWCHRFYAFALGYFWRPCPICGDPFGGHEWRDIDGKPSGLPVAPGTSIGICPRCTRAGRGVRRWIEELL